MKVSDYIAQYLIDFGIKDAFTVVGGGAMHLNDSFGRAKGLKVWYNHHEQACAIAAEAYARINNMPALLCVTTGPGGTNAITGVVGGWLDSIPMIVISGQVRYDTTARSTGLALRAMGDQEFDICKAVQCMTKYCEMVTDAKKIKYCLHKALLLATSGRPGPCWLDIPLNIQGAYVETDELSDYILDPSLSNTANLDKALINTILNKISESERPVLYAGNGIRLSGGYDTFCRLISKLNIPVVTNWDSIDLIPDSDPLYVGRGGMMGDRAGNFAVQNSDLVLSIGSRLSIRQVGYNWTTWARGAFVIMEDVDEAELKKPTLHIDIPVYADAKVFMQALFDLSKEPVFNKTKWLTQCSKWKEKYPVVLKKHYDDPILANPYCFIKELSKRLPEKKLTVVGNGTACVVGSQSFEIKKDQRFIINSAIASMGYDLPAAIGACIAKGCEDCICITGDGSIQMNIQELQTIIFNKLPIKIFIINNNGYQSIRITQTNIFNKTFFGIGPESNDISFPDMEKIAYAYGYPYYKITSNSQMVLLTEILSKKGYLMCEIFVNSNQFFEPKSATKKLEDGSLYSPPLEDLAPFLDRKELKRNMYIE